MKGLIIVNAYSKMEHSLNQSKRLRQEFERLGVVADIMRNDSFICSIQNGEIVSRAAEYSFCIYLDKDKYISRMLEISGLKLFNSHTAIRDCDDKMDTYLRLAGHGISMPKTLAGLLCYDESEKVNEETAEIVGSRLGYPMVVKNCYGSLGSGVFKADNIEELLSVMGKVKMQPHLFQEYVESSAGKDVRVIVIGGKAVASMQRRNSSDFRSNIERGGIGETIELSDSFRAAAERAANVLGLDYCGVDLLYGLHGEPLVCEVNSNAFFGGIESVTGINVAKLYAEYIISNLST